MKNSFWWFWKSFRTFSNWYCVYWAKITKTESARLVTRKNNVVFALENLNSNLGTIQEIFYEDAYIEAYDLLEGKKEPVVVDIGANIGSFSLYVYKCIKSSRIHAYEPEETNFQLLCENIRQNNLENAIISHKQAVCGTEGVRQLSLAGVSSGKNSLAITQQSGMSQDVVCTTLERIFESVAHCDLLKIDCEGSEYEILFGAPVALFQNIDALIIEWHPVEGYTPEGLEDFLREQGYIVSRSPRFVNTIIARK